MHLQCFLFYTLVVFSTLTTVISLNVSTSAPASKVFPKRDIYMDDEDMEGSGDHDHDRDHDRDRDHESERRFDDDGSGFGPDEDSDPIDINPPKKEVKLKNLNTNYPTDDDRTLPPPPPPPITETVTTSTSKPETESTSDIFISTDNKKPEQTDSVPFDNTTPSRNEPEPPYDNDRNGSGVSITNNRSDSKPTSFFSQPDMLAAVIGGAVIGLLCAILIVMFIVYRMKKKDEGSYVLEEMKRSPASNPYLKPNHREFFA